TGNVGIGSTAPGYALDVVGELNLTDAIRVAGNAGTAGYLLTSSGGGANTWTDPATLGSGSSLWSNTANVLHPKDELASVVDLAIGGTSTASADILLQSNGKAYFGGNVGIGTTTASQKLQVNGTAMFGTANASEVLLGMSANTLGHEGFSVYHNGTSSYLESVDFGIGWQDMNFTALNFNFASGGTGNDLYIASTGNVGIGTNSPGSYNLNVNGGAYATTQTLYGGTTSNDGGELRFTGTQNYAYYAAPRFTVTSATTPGSFKDLSRSLSFIESSGSGFSKYGTYDTIKILSNNAGIQYFYQYDTVTADTPIRYRTADASGSNWNAWRSIASEEWVDSTIDTRINGTSSYLPKFTSANTIGNSIIYETSSRIGIGTTSVTNGKVSIRADLTSSDFWNSGLDIDMNATAGSGSYYVGAHIDAFTSISGKAPVGAFISADSNVSGTGSTGLIALGGSPGWSRSSSLNYGAIIAGEDVGLYVPDGGVVVNQDITISGSLIGGQHILKPRVVADADVYFNKYDATGSFYFRNTSTLGGTSPANELFSIDNTGSLYSLRTYNSTASQRDVFIDSNGRFGYLSSSIKNKTNVSTITDSKSEQIYDLRPVKFEYKDSIGTIQYGLIAEEVAVTIPEMAFYDENGDPAGVSYQFLAPLLLVQAKKHETKLNSIVFDDSGYLSIVDQNAEYVVVNTATHSIVDSIVSANRAIIANIVAGLTRTKDLIVENTATIANLDVSSLRINGQPIAEYIASIITNEVGNYANTLVSPLGNDTIISTASVSGEIAFANANGETVAAITEDGDFSAQGTSSLGSLFVETDATISGSLTTTTINSQTSRLGSILADGPATFSATLSAESVVANQITATSTRLTQLESKLAEVEKLSAVAAEIETATVSGTLYANTIDGLDTKIYNATASQKSSLLTILTGTDSITSISDVIQTVDSLGYTATRSADINMSLSDLMMESDDISLNVDALFVNKYFKVNGGAYIADSLGIGRSIFVEKNVSAGESVTVANTLSIGGDTIAYSGAETFQIQPSGTGSLSLMAGLIVLEENGTATVNGDFVIEQDATVKGTLFANLLQPTDLGNPLQVQVAGISDTNEVKKSRFEIIDELGTPVATISAEGKAAFAGGVSIGSENLGVADVNNLDEANRPLLQSNKTSGKAIIPSGSAEITIRSSKIGPESLIYVTPVGSTNNQVLYVKSQQEENPSENKQGEFVVGFDEALNQEVHLNWWIVN
ncbi:tail fiber domain-containing protein, partial [Candidatus Woesebacteria bacterium]|nr:tail fiber domain-containing protein [Candidatus Woesebacteria bacterium]